MPAKSKYIKPEDAAGNGNGEGPLAILTAREQTMLLQGLLTVPGFPGVSQSSNLMSDPAALVRPRNIRSPFSVSPLASALASRQQRAATITTNALALFPTHH
jgi:hypothetical protein